MISTRSQIASEPFVSDTYRQKLLLAYTKSNDAGSEIIAWSLYDGTGRYEFEASDLAEEDCAPYHSIVDAMRDGWRVLQIPRMDMPRAQNHDNYELGTLPYEWALEQWERIDG